MESSEERIVVCGREQTKEDGRMLDLRSRKLTILHAKEEDITLI